MIFDEILVTISNRDNLWVNVTAIVEVGQGAKKRDVRFPFKLTYFFYLSAYTLQMPRFTPLLAVFSTLRPAKSIDFGTSQAPYVLRKRYMAINKESVD